MEVGYNIVGVIKNIMFYSLYGMGFLQDFKTSAKKRKRQQNKKSYIMTSFKLTS